MSHTIVKPCNRRLNRTELAVPGSNARFLEKAAQGDADVVFFDLEDSVAPSEKESARKRVIETLHDSAWKDRTVSVRINGLDTHYMYRDVVDVVEQAGEHLDLMMIPKVGTASDVYAIDMIVTQIEEAKGISHRIGFELIIETALGMQNIAEIAAASDRIESLHFGVADYAASTQARTTSIGGPNPDYATLTAPVEEGSRTSHWGDMWHYALSRLVVTARANGLRPIDGPFGDIGDLAGYEARARASAALGCDGKWAIHPSQIEIANAVFSPSKEEIEYAKNVIDAMAEATSRGEGAVSLNGRMIDWASIRQAETMVAKSDAIASRD